MMNKQLKTICALFLFFALLLSLGVPAFADSPEGTANTVSASEMENTEPAGDCADDRVMVVIDQETSRLFRTYDTADFAGLSCAGVTDLTLPVRNQMLETLDRVQALYEANTDGVDAAAAALLSDVNWDAYRQVLCLELDDPAEGDVRTAIQALQQRTDVVYAGPDYYLTTDAIIPNDNGYVVQWAAEKIHLPDAWGITTGSSLVKVGLIDTGIDASHPDFDTRVSTTLSRDFTGETVTIPDPVTDPHGNGTMMAGVIGAKGNNGEFFAGVSWNVQLVSLRVLNQHGGGSSSDVARAVSFATEYSIPILNIPLAYNAATADEAMYTVMANYPGLIVCSAGNDFKDNDSTPLYPCCYDLPNVIAVGASDQSDRKLDISCYGKTTVDIFAPGDCICSCYPNEDELTRSGTSFAAAYVSGVAALLLSRNSRLTPFKLRHIIMHSADIVTDANGNSVFGDLCVSGGRLNAYAALVNYNMSFSVVNQGIHSGHRTVCSVCEEYIVNAHSWEDTSTTKRCSVCGASSKFVPVRPGEGDLILGTGDTAEEAKNKAED